MKFCYDKPTSKCPLYGKEQKTGEDKILNKFLAEIKRNKYLALILLVDSGSVEDTADFGSAASHFGDFTYALFGGAGDFTFDEAMALCASMNGYLALPMVTEWLDTHIIYGYSEFKHSGVGINVNVFFHRTQKKTRTSLISKKKVFSWLQLTRDKKAYGLLSASAIQANT